MKPDTFNVLGWMRKKLFAHKVPAFILLGAGRSGSTWLRSLLHSHRNLYVHKELCSLYNPLKFPEKYFYDRAGLIDHVLNERYDLLIKRVGFKLLYDHDGDIVQHKYFIERHKAVAAPTWGERLSKTLERLESEVGAEEFHGNVQRAWQRLADDSSLKIIHLIRRNELRRYLSQELSLKSDEWFRHQGDQARKVSLPVDVDDFWERKKEVETLRKEKLALFQSQEILTIYYEDLLERHEDTLGKIFEFLEIPPAKLYAPEIPQHPEPMRELIENYEEVKKRLRGTEAEVFLEDA